MESSEPIDIAVAATPCDIESVPAIVADISSLASKVSSDSSARLALIEQARSLVRALETPRETMIRHCWAEPTCFAALTFGVDVGLFPLLADDGGSPKDAHDLANTLGVDPPLLCRLMRHLSSMGCLVETGPDMYKPTNFSRALGIPIIGDGYPCISGCVTGTLSKFHEFARKTNYQTPTSINHGLLQYANNTELNCFEFLATMPQLSGQFNRHMSAYRLGRPSWMDPGFYPVRERLMRDADTSAGAVFLVDIGGSIGHDMDEFRRKHPDAPGRLVLQDLPAVLDHCGGLHERIERMPYDFHTEQPVEGARAYYMHSVLHDWPDEVSAKILARVKAAMKPGYSRLLINENVIPSEKAQWEATALDILMLALVSSRERTEADWHHLIEDLAGLKIRKIWHAANGVESVIECELA